MGGEWIPVDPDSRGYTDEFDCSNCGGTVHLGYYSKVCDYTYCPWCAAVMDEGNDEE